MEEIKELLKSVIQMAVNNNKEKETINNKKENEMSLLDEIKKLIIRVENNKGGEEMTLKEKIINILNSNDVDIDTIEEVENAIDEAEAKVENSKEEEKEKEPEENEENVENSEEKPEEENEEEKQEEKKVDNSVENSEENKVDNAKPDYFAKLNEIYNSANETKQTNEFRTRQERLEDGRRF